MAPRCEATPASAERIIWEHRELFHAIRERDVERARAMVRVQIRSAMEANSGYHSDVSADDDDAATDVSNT